MVSRATKLKRGEAIPQDPFINKAGYIITSKINDTMQGSIYRAIKQSTKQSVVIKKTSLELHSKSIVIVDGIKYRVNENILKETAILKYFHDDKNCPKSIVQYIDSFKRYSIYVYVCSLFLGNIYTLLLHKTTKRVSQLNISFKSFNLDVQSLCFLKNYFDAF